MQAYQSLLYPLAMLYVKGIKENQSKSIKIKENPISDLEAAT